MAAILNELIWVLDRPKIMFGFGGCKSFAIFEKQKLELGWPLAIVTLKKGICYKLFSRI
jgi:hypothetical protein